MEEMRVLSRHRFARRLRPLTALARLAARDVRNETSVEPEATPGRAAALLSHRLFGTIA
jgi:phytoene synthase